MSRHQPGHINQITLMTDELRQRHREATRPARRTRHQTTSRHHTTHPALAAATQAVDQPYQHRSMGPRPTGPSTSQAPAMTHRIRPAGYRQPRPGHIHRQSPAVPPNSLSEHRSQNSARNPGAQIRQLQQTATGNGNGHNFVLVRFAPGPRRAADIADFSRAMNSFCAKDEQSTCVVTDQRPNGVTGYARIDSTPEVLAGILAILGLAVLGQLTVTSARRRRHDFAILRTLGLLRRQLTAVTAWQVTTLTGLALLLGLPAGVAAGHWAWGLFAGNAGIPSGAITPVPLVLLMVPAAILAANAIALPSGRHCARLNPAAVLRSE
jgi:hypothetical protein